MKICTHENYQPYGIVYGYYTQKRNLLYVTEPALTCVCHDKTSPLYMLPVHCDAQHACVNV